MNIFEGGNVFKDAMGVPLTQRIQQADIPGTVQYLETVTGLDLSGPDDPNTGYPVKWLGSTGKKSDSGDLDLAVMLSDTTKPQLKAKLDQFVTQQGQDPRDFVRLSGEAVHFKTPILGNAKNGFVQTDFMFLPDLGWGSFFLAGGQDSNYKGNLRNILMSSIAKTLGLKVGPKGVVSRTTDQVISLDPDVAAEYLLGTGRTKKDLKNVETIYKNLASDPDRDAKLKDFREYLAREGVQEPQIVKENDVHFLARLRDRIVNQGMYALIESEKSPLTEGKDPRIPYVEDLVFKKGLTGLADALNIIKQSAEKTAQYVSIKWDGSPAVIFGRLPDGQFVLTDKAGASATGYDGLATSPEKMAAIMAQRDRAAAAQGKVADRSEKLTPMYRDIWPYFEAAVPKDFRGFVKGDLLYYPTLPYQEQTGNWIFRPNRTPGGIEYKIPINSPLGQQIQSTQVGVAVHTQMDEPAGVERPFNQDPSKIFNSVPGIMITGPYVNNLQNLEPNPKIVSQLRKIANSKLGQDINSLLNPADLRAMQITDLPALMERYINSLKGTDFTSATPSAFLAWLQDGNVNPRKFNNIYAHLTSPKSNASGMAAAFAAWNLLEQLANDLNRQLDLQQPGQEGWVMAPPAGRAKLVSRRAGGFGARGTQPQTT
jgi:hypothetical protein